MNYCISESLLTAVLLIDLMIGIIIGWLWLDKPIKDRRKEI